MPNVTIDNVSPLIQYQPGWTEGSVAGDSSWFNYSAGTFTLCTGSGVSASFSFNGTAIWLFGAKRSNHDLYNATLDGVVATSNGSANPYIFQAALFSATNLANTLHTVTLTNAGTQAARDSDYLDLDYIAWETSYGLDGQQINETIIQDSDSSFSYQPRDAWDTTVSDLSQYVGNSGHETYNDGAYATLGFTGNAVEIFGSVGPNSAPYTVQLDGGSISTYNATKANKITPVPIYYADNLGPGSHNVKITHTSVSENQGLFINYARVMASSSSSSVPGSRPSGPDVSVIAGTVVGSLAVIGILACFFIWRWRNRESAGKQPPPMAQHFSTISQMTPYMTPQSLPSNPRSHLNPDVRPYDSQPSHDVQHHSGVYGQRKGAPVQSPSTTSQSSSHVPETDRTHNVVVRRKGGHVQLPSTAGQSSTLASEAESLTPNVDVEARPRDHGRGPVEEEMPPPDYNYATES
jgi:hypothetical protein